MINLLRSELFRLRHRPQSWLLVVIASLFMALIYGGLTVGTFFTSSEADKVDLEDQLRLTNIREFGLSLNTLFGGIMLVILAAGLIGNEYGWNTIRPIVARARSRTALLAAKFLTLAIYTVVFSIALALVTAIISFICATIVGVSWGFSTAVVMDAIWYTVGIITINLPGVALAFMLALWTRSNAAGIGVALGISFLEPAIFALLGNINDVFTSIEKWGISWNAIKVLSDGVETDRGLLSIGMTLGYAALFTIGSFVIFRRRDITSG